jgi:lysophospholipase L1-like esterase
MAACFARFRDGNAASPWHIFHFGDSQIEGDRFTSTIRSRFQEVFGGQGPGWLSIAPPSPSFSVNLNTPDPTLWHRATRYMTADSLIHDERYGWMAARSDADSGAAFVIHRHPRCAPTARNWNRMEIWLDTASHDMPLRWRQGPNGPWQDTIVPASSEQLRQIKWSGNQDELPAAVGFPAGASRVLHVALWTDSAGGVLVHNIPMRGSSGTLFSRLDRDVLADQIRNTSPALVFLQFGGNAVPYLQSTEAAQRYGRWFAANLRRIKALMPEAQFVIIANADMSENIEGQWQTKPMVQPMRDALKDAAMREHAVFFDLFEAMGGENSMPGWVAAEPQLAASDHVHFTRRGAHALAELLVQALMELDPETADQRADEHEN